jgi:arabinan endo-1,5-alpha-L-arabinosidase
MNPRGLDLVACLVFAHLVPASFAASAEPVGRRALRIHDPSTIVVENGFFWVFGTGKRILTAKSTDLLAWTRLGSALTEPPAWATEIAPGNKAAHYWAPDVIKIGERYHLYYSVSEFGKNTSAIGLSTSPSLDPASPDHRWQDRGIVLRSGAGDDFNAIDPSVLLDADGRLWMAYGSFWRGLFLIELDPATGLRLAPTSPVQHLAEADEIEAATLVRHGDYHYLFFNVGLCCRAKASTYRILVGRSQAITGPYLDDNGRDLRAGGGREFLDKSGAFIGPGHATILKENGREWVAVHFYDGSRDGQPTLALRRLTWTDDGWPRVAD